ncbi:phospholipid/cholesterol/gamma-HCH transport system permease protein [Collimonas sp. OK307]|uniref:MlaE family ABC transporter permease n=1 Tax=Collimonas sp. OK307 TaxID=1801620 RepID=UPI0008F329FD|nr:ABC transporter permease [Collimonas sp. OK307]SFI09805.1 phospholipid/cholesterol/gamma-HCH transport system permease protein [Collimonas sp. OK307]
MHPTSSSYLKPEQWAVTVLRAASSWWRMLHLAGIALVMGLSPSTYHRANRNTTYRYIYTSTWQILPWFTLLFTLLSLVLIRIVLVTALSYGLSRYALEMMVRVLVLELIPLSAALFVALRAGAAFNSPQLLASQSTAAPDISRLQQDLVPRTIACAFSVLSLATVSGVIVLLLAYINVYGISPWGLPDYTRTVGRVFDPAVTLGFALKTLLFGLAVAVIPTAAVIDAARRNITLSSTLQPGATRLLFVLVLIEVGGLAVKYI